MKSTLIAALVLVFVSQKSTPQTGSIDPLPRSRYVCAQNPS